MFQTIHVFSRKYDEGMYELNQNKIGHANILNYVIQKFELQ